VSDEAYELMLRVPESTEEGYSEWYDEDARQMVRFFTDGNGNVLEELKVS
jgi:hypothetical protein